MRIVTTLSIVSVLLASSCKSNPKQESTEDTANNATAQQETPIAEPEPEPQNEQKVKITTSMGDIVLKLYNETPKHRDNFIKLVKEGYYNDLLFHRVMKTFMIQGGDPNSRTAVKGQALGEGGPNYNIPAEFNPKLYHKRGALAAARQPDQVNPQKESSGSQFYIVQGKPFNEDELNNMAQRGGLMFTDEQKNVYQTVGGAPFLDMNYTVFGEVVEGMDVVDKIAAQPVDENNRPFKDVKFSISLLDEASAPIDANEPIKVLK